MILIHVAVFVAAFVVFAAVDQAVRRRRREHRRFIVAPDTGRHFWMVLDTSVDPPSRVRVGGCEYWYWKRRRAKAAAKAFNLASESHQGEQS